MLKMNLNTVNAEDQQPISSNGLEFARLHIIVYWTIAVLVCRCDGISVAVAMDSLCGSYYFYWLILTKTWIQASAVYVQK